MGYLKIVIPIIITIIIAGVISFNLEQEPVKKFTNEEQIEWRSSGPFSIEKDQYYLGEKIFLTVNYIPKDVKGEVIFFRPTETPNINEINEIQGISKELIQAKIKYIGIPFDGNAKENFNRYFEPKLNEIKNVCSTNDLVGEWVIVFSGTDYQPMYFEIINEIAPWSEKEAFQPIC